MAQNPIRKIRDQKEVTQHELALAAGVSVSTVRNIENGQVGELNQKLIAFLEEKGYKPEKLKKDYKDWLEAKSKEAAAKF